MVGAGAGTGEAPAIAGILFERGDGIDALLAGLVTRLAGRGSALAGALQIARPGPPGGRPELWLVEIGGSWEVALLETRGAGARGCRLDPRAVAEAAGRLEGDIACGPDLLVLNRFGKAEAEGGGLRSVIEGAAAAGIPVLAGVRADFAADWAAFHGGLGTTLAPRTAAVEGWLTAQGLPARAAVAS